MPVIITKDNVQSVVETVKLLTSREVLIGIPATAAPRDDGQETDFNNAAIGYINETGQPELNIPPRPHLIPGVQVAGETAAKYLGQGARKALTGDRSQVEASFDKAGFVCVASVRKMISDVLAPPLAPATLAARQRRGNEGETPLIDTGEYYQHLTYVVRDANAKR